MNETKTINTAARPGSEGCVLSTTRRALTDLGALLDSITAGQTVVELGDMIGIELTDGTEVELVVTDQGDEFVRFESRDCLGINTSARKLDEYLEKVYDLLPAALKDRITEVERVHLDARGEKRTERCRLFVPAAPEIFPTDECYGEEGLYTQLEWYKDVHNRVRAHHKGSYSHWYWTSSRSANSSTSFCSVFSNGSAYGNTASSAYGVAPFGCILPKTR